MNRLAGYAFVPLCVAATVTLPLRAAADSGAFVNAKIVPPAFVHTLTALRKRTRLPIVVPPKLDSGVFAQIDAATVSGYVLDTGLSRDCGGAHACGWFALSATRAKPEDALRFGERISLGRGVDGDLSPPRMTAYPTDSVIAWRLAGVAYRLSVNSHGPAPAALARSIVANLITLPAGSRLTTAPERAPLAARSVRPSLRSGIAELRRVTQLPVYVPAIFPLEWSRLRLTVDEPNSAAKGADNERSYAYFLTRDAACRSHYCAYAGFAVDSNASDSGGSPVALGSGITARTQPAGYWERSLVWTQHGREATLGTSDEKVTLDDLKRVARSIVTNAK